MLDRGDSGGGSSSSSDDPAEDSSGSDPVDHSSDGGVWSDTDAREEEQFRGVQSGTIDDEDTAAPGNGDVTTHQRELLSGQERSGGSTAASVTDDEPDVDDTTANVNNIPGSTNYDVTADDASDGGFGATPGTSGVSATNDPETDGADPTGIDSINTDDPAQATQAVADVVDDTADSTQDAANDAATTARTTAQNAAQQARDAAPDPTPDLTTDVGRWAVLLVVALLTFLGVRTASGGDVA